MSPRETGRLVVSRLPAPLQMQVWERAVAFHRALERLADAPVSLTLTDNQHAMLRVRRDPGIWEIRAHHLFVDADAVTIKAILTLGQDRRSEARAKLARDVILRFATERADQGAAPSAAKVRLKTRGQTHDLAALYAALCAALPPEAAGLSITWGRWGRRDAQQRHVRLGSYEPLRRLIRIHPALDQPAAPAWVVSFVIFHEILHHLFPSQREGGRLIHHSATFRAAEERHPDHARYQQWTRDHLWGLLASSRA